jgi:hypothetical protein
MVSIACTAARLGRIAAALRRIGDAPVLALHVAGGQLSINWKRKPNAGEVAAVASVWRRCNHYVAGAELLVDAPGRNPFRGG